MCLLCSEFLAQSFWYHQKKWVKHSMTYAWLWCLCLLWICCCNKVIQWNTFNKQRSIDAIVFWFYLACKTSYQSICLIITTQNILIQPTTFEWFMSCVDIVMCTQDVYMWEMKLYLLYGRNVETGAKISNRCLHNNKLFFLCIVLQVSQS